MGRVWYLAGGTDVVGSTPQSRVRRQGGRACRSKREELWDVDPYEGDVGRRSRGSCGHLQTWMTHRLVLTGCHVPPLQELDVPFYFTPAKVAGTFHCSTPALSDVAYVRRTLPPTAALSFDPMSSLFVFLYPPLARRCSTQATKSRARTRQQGRSRRPPRAKRSMTSSGRGHDGIPYGWTEFQRRRPLRGC